MALINLVRKGVIVHCNNYKMTIHCYNARHHRESHCHVCGRKCPKKFESTITVHLKLGSAKAPHEYLTHMGLLLRPHAITPDMSLTHITKNPNASGLYILLLDFTILNCPPDHVIGR